MLNTTTMQNVAWPRITVNNPKLIPSGTRTVLNEALSAIPVMIPGSAIGRITRKLMESRPKKSYLATANATIEPRTIAIRVAPTPALILVSSAARTPSLVAAFVHQSVVHAVGGHEKTFEALKELIKMTNSGK